MNHEDLVEMTIAQLQAGMAAGDFTAEEITAAYIERIEKLDQDGPRVNSVLHQSRGT